MILQGVGAQILGAQEGSSAGTQLLAVLRLYTVISGALHSPPLL
jgi:hypothetical protein